MKKLFLIIIMAVSLLPDLYAAEHGARDETVVTIVQPGSYYARKFFLFPLEIPGYAFRVVTLPLGVALRFAEKKHLLEKTLDFLSNKKKTFWVYPIVEGGAGNGFGGGVGLRHTDLFHKGYLGAAAYRIHVDMSQQADMSFAKPKAVYLFDRPLSFSIGSSFSRTFNNAFFGIGTDSSRSNEVGFDSAGFDSGVTLFYEFMDNFSLSPYLGFSATKVSNANGGSLPATGVMFPVTYDEGLGERLDYIAPGIKFIHDTRNRIDYPEHGGIQSLTYRYYGCINDGNFRFNNYELDVSQYFGLWKPRQVLVLHTKWKFEQTTNNGRIPFFLLSTLDANSPLRGFVQGRFRDRDFALFNVEYRFPIWDMVDGAVFLDAGRVFHAPNDFSFKRFKYSPGAEIKINIPHLLMFRFEAAYGGEGVNFIFGASKPI